MKWNKKQTEQSNKTKKQRKVPAIKMGTHKKLTIALWLLLIGSVSFGVYKNFTAIDVHTIHEKEVIEQRIIDTNALESYVSSFAGEYFSWQQSQEAIDQRNERLKDYLTEDLQQLTLDMVRADIPTSSTVTSVQIWSVSEINPTDFTVLFSVIQQLTEGETKQNLQSTYTVVVHIDNADDMVIIQNPTMSRKPDKSDYQPNQVESDETIDAVMSEEITSFLETFFKLYPNASEKELAYYVSDHALPVVNKEYMFVEVVSSFYKKQSNNITANVSVKYLDEETKITQLHQYKLCLEMNDNWKIVERLYN